MTAKYEVPYYCVIFTSLLSETDEEYAHYNQFLEDEAKKYPGFLGMDSARTGLGISVSYWKDTETIQAWKKHTDHIYAQQKGINKWYERYIVRIVRIEREYEFIRKS